jgi:hypothetical protein
MNAAFITLALSFTLPGVDHYTPGFQLHNLGTVATEQQCDKILVEPVDLKITGGTELKDMRLAKEGMCIKGVAEANATATMLIEAASRTPRLHLHQYSAITLPNFETLQQCNRTVSKLSALLPRDGAGKVVDIWATCYTHK